MDNSCLEYHYTVHNQTCFELQYMHVVLKVFKIKVKYHGQGNTYTNMLVYTHT